MNSQRAIATIAFVFTCLLILSNSALAAADVSTPAVAPRVIDVDVNALDGPLDRFFSDGYSFLVEMLYVAARLGNRIAEVPITFVERREGESKVSRAVLYESATTPWIELVNWAIALDTVRQNSAASCILLDFIGDLVRPGDLSDQWI